MGIGAGLFLIALGAIFAFAVTGEPISFISIHAVGWILMVIGLAGILISVFYWGPRRRATTTTRDRVYTDDPTQPPPPL